MTAVTVLARQRRLWLKLLELGAVVEAANQQSAYGLQESLSGKNLIPRNTITTLGTHSRRDVISATSRCRRLSNYVRNCIWPTWSDSDDPYLESPSLFILFSQPPNALIIFLFFVLLEWADDFMADENSSKWEAPLPKLPSPHPSDGSVAQTASRLASPLKIIWWHSRHRRR